MQKTPQNVVTLMGMKINNINNADLFRNLNETVKENKKKYISITNTEAMYIGLKNKSHYDYINNSYLSLCDGTGIVLAGKVNGFQINKYHGPDFFEDVIKEGVKFGWTHFFLGGKEGCGKTLKSHFKSSFEGVKIIGHYSPPFRILSKQEEMEMINKINALKPNFLWVSLGLPKQEKWIAKYIDKLDINFSIGVGAAFDFHSGNVKRAPIFFQRIGLEWFYRTLFERRLVVRQLRGFNFMFKAILNNFFK